jgi:DNA polymerase-1
MPNSLYIIDGHAQIYAAYYAATGGNLTAASGEPTKATYIFTTMMLKLLKERTPDMLVVTMDSPGRSFRHEMYDQYKANRSAMPEDLPKQIERIEQILAAMDVPMLRVAGYEADDIIATLTRQGQKQGYKIYICSRDKDLEQLIDKDVSMYDMRKDIELNLAGFTDAMGIAPHQSGDVLALAGDTADNIPGLPDVGPKTALQWIQQYGSLEALIEHKDEIKGKRGDNLRANLEQLLLARKLVTLDHEVPLDLDWSAMTVKKFDTTSLSEIFRELGFSRLLTQLDLQEKTIQQTKPQTPVANVEYVLVDNPQAFDDFYNQLHRQSRFAIDTETTGLNPMIADLVGLSFSWQPYKGYYLPVKAPLGQKHLDWSQISQKLRPILTDPAVKKIGQNIKYDMIVLRKAGIELQGVDFDTMVASYVLYNDQARHNMDSMALDYLGHETIKFSSLTGKGKNQLTFNMVDTQLACDYAAEDADVTWRLAQYLSKQLKDKADTEQGKGLLFLFEHLEMPLVEVLAEMEYQGIAIDLPWLKKLGTRISQRLDELTEQIHQRSGCVFNVDSPKQLGQVLFEKLSLPTGKQTKTGYSTDQEVLEGLQWQHPIVELLLEYRQLSKLRNTYTDKLASMVCPATRRVHASFNQAITATGRLSSSDPNLQNIPIRTELGQEVRKAFIPQAPGDVILAADYSQVELRMLAHFSKDKQLLAAFAGGQDIHRSVAAQVHGIALEDVSPDQRSRAKAVNFGIVYGQSAYGLSRGIGISVAEAQTFIDDYFNRYPAIRGFIDETIAQAGRQGFVTTILGRQRYLPDINSKNAGQRKLAERMAVNTVIQGSAADLIKMAMINLHRKIKQENLAIKMMLQVHDELVFETPQEKANDYAEIIRQQMTTAIKLQVPLAVDIGWGANWLDCK